jgi:phage host-nuclease inhibitor protein Gam
MTKAKAKPKGGPLVPVPLSREEAAAALARIGVIEARIAARKAVADEAVREAGEAYAKDTEQLLAELKDTRAGLEAWCEAHRAELTAGGRAKSCELGTGRVGWRSRPPKVRLARGVGEEAVIDACKRLGLVQFVRVREELARDVMLADPGLARTVAGVTVAGEGEDFFVEPAALAAGTAGA